MEARATTQMKFKRSRNALPSDKLLSPVLRLFVQVDPVPKHSGITQTQRHYSRMTPAPDIRTDQTHTRVVLFAHQDLVKMDKRDRIRACYQHSCLLHVSNRVMTNATLRERFKISGEDDPVASRIIRDTIDAHLIKPADPESKSKRLLATPHSGLECFMCWLCAKRKPSVWPQPSLIKVKSNVFRGLAVRASARCYVKPMCKSGETKRSGC